MYNLTSIDYQWIGRLLHTIDDIVTDQRLGRLLIYCCRRKVPTSTRPLDGGDKVKITVRHWNYVRTWYSYHSTWFSVTDSCFILAATGYVIYSTTSYIVSMRFELTDECGAVNLHVAYAATEANPNTELKEVFWKKLGHLVEQIPTKECIFVLVDKNARTGRMEGCGDGRVLGAYGRDELNDNGKRLLTFASDNNLARTNTFLAHLRVEYLIRLTGSAALMTGNRLTTSKPAKHIDLAYIMLRFTPSLRLQPRRVQTITSYTRWSTLFVIAAVVSTELRRTSDWTIWITELSICRLLSCHIFENCEERSRSVLLLM